MARFSYDPAIIDRFPSVVGGVIHAEGVSNGPASSELIAVFAAEQHSARERIGEFIQRVGLGDFLEAVGVEPIPEMVSVPRENPYIFYEEYIGDDDEDE